MDDFEKPVAYPRTRLAQPHPSARLATIFGVICLILLLIGIPYIKTLWDAPIATFTLVVPAPGIFFAGIPIILKALKNNETKAATFCSVAYVLYLLGALCTIAWFAIDN